jgi:hypothetical protein
MFQQLAAHAAATSVGTNGQAEGPAPQVDCQRGPDGLAGALGDHSSREPQWSL